MGYTQYYPMQQTMPPQGTQAANNGIIWVQGEAGAKSYLVAPNNTVQLWDSESQTIYLKSADASGMPLPLRTFEYKEVGTNEETEVAPAQSTYVTKEELNEAISKLKKSLKEKKDEQFAI